MAWIESHQALREHPKTLALCEALGIAWVPAVGHLHLLWWWCLDYAITGDLRKFSVHQIAMAAEWPGEAAKFVKALVEAGLLETQPTEKGARPSFSKHERPV